MKYNFLIFALGMVCVFTVNAEDDSWMKDCPGPSCPSHHNGLPIKKPRSVDLKKANFAPDCPGPGCPNNLHGNNPYGGASGIKGTSSDNPYDRSLGNSGMQGNPYLYGAGIGVGSSTSPSGSGMGVGFCTPNYDQSICETPGGKIYKLDSSTNQLGRSAKDLAPTAPSKEDPNKNIDPR